MKVYFLILVVLFLLPMGAFATDCPNFAGSYKWESEDKESFTLLKAEQNGCTDLKFTYDNGWGFLIVHKHIFDGQKRLVEDNGDFQAYETATINADGIKIFEERHVKDEEEGGAEDVYFVNFEIFFVPDGRLIIVQKTVRSDGVITDVDKSEYNRTN